MSELAKNQPVAFAGHLGADPKLSRTNEGVAVANMSVAYTPRVREGDQWVNGETVWYSVAAFRSLGENVAASFKKGDRVLVVGRQDDVEFERKDGSTGIDHKVVADSIGADLTFATVDIHPVRAASREASVSGIGMAG